MGRLLPFVAGVVASALVLTGVAQSSGIGRSQIREGGTFRVSLWAPSFRVDPALTRGVDGAPRVVDTTCARLMAYPDKPPPEGFTLTPEVAASYPRVSRNMKTFTFTIRPGFRFSNGEHVRANAFARAINRTLAPAMRSPFAIYTRDIAGAADVLAGRRTSAAGVVAKGNELVVRFTRPVPDFPAQTTMTAFCAVPPDLPVDAEGVTTFPAAGPYYVADYRSGQRVVLERNPHYRGSRPHHVNRYVIDLTVSSREAALDRVERGVADYTLGLPPPVMLDPARGLVAKFGVNRSRFFVKPGLVLRHYLLNTSRPLFRNNAALRRAVNFAIDRAAQLESLGGPHATTLSDQYLPQTIPGYRDADIYPLRRPDLRTARRLARGRTRGGKAILYTRDNPPALALAQLVKRDLAAVGLEVEIKAFAPLALLDRLARPNEPWDIGFAFSGPDYFDHYAFLNVQFDGRFAGKTNLSWFDSSVFNLRLRKAASLRAEARERRYGNLDVELARDAAPVVAIGFQTMMTLVSGRVGCVVHNPDFNLTAACLK